MSQTDIFLKSRHVQKHDIEENWAKAVNFIPLKAEIIVYDVDETHDYERFKIGDGVTKVSELPFNNVSSGGIQNITTGEGLKATKAGTDVTIEIDQDIIFLLDCGTSESDDSLFALEENESGGQTAVIG